MIGREGLLLSGSQVLDIHLFGGHLVGAVDGDEGDAFALCVLELFLELGGLRIYLYGYALGPECLGYGKNVAELVGPHDGKQQAGAFQSVREEGGARFLSNIQSRRQKG